MGKKKTKGEGAGNKCVAAVNGVVHVSIGKVPLALGLATIIAGVMWGVAIQVGGKTAPTIYDNRDIVGDSSVNGGWLEERNPEVLIGGDRCDFDVVSYKELSPKQFRTQYMGKRPVMITDYIDDHWTARTKRYWSRTVLQAFQHSSATKVGSGSAIVYSGGNSVKTTTLGQFLNDMRNNIGASFGSDFDFDVHFFESNPQLLKDFDIPPHFASLMPLESVDDRMAWYMFSLGASKGGLPWHVHGETWIGLVFGMKRWAVYPPGKSTPRIAEEAGGYHPLMGSHEWFRDVAYRIPAAPNATAPLHCIQHAGDIVYLPRNWKHMTMNVGETIGAGGQLVYDMLDRLQDATEVLKEAPFDFEALSSAGLSHAHRIATAPTKREAVRYAQTAVAFFDRAIKEKAGHPEVHLLKAETLLQVGKRDEAVQAATRLLSIVEAAPTDVPTGTIMSVYLNIARFFMASEQWQQVADVLSTHVLSLQHDHPDALADLGIALAKLRRFDEADAALNKASALLSAHAEIKHRQAWVSRERQLQSYYELHQQEDTADEGAQGAQQE